VSLIRDAPLVVGDTGPFCRIAETNALEALLSYLGANLVIVREVEAELRFRADQPQHKSLRPDRARNPPFVTRETIELDATTQHNVTVIARRWRERDIKQGKPDRGEHANVGEIATVLAAEQQGRPVLMGDGAGQEFAASKGLTVHSTEELLAEMVAARALSPRLGFLIYQRVYGSDRAAFDVAVAAAVVPPCPRPERLDVHGHRWRELGRDGRRRRSYASISGAISAASRSTSPTVS
jgi:hypothetical protein